MIHQLPRAAGVVLLVLAGTAPPTRAQSNPLYLMVPADKGFKITHVEKEKASEAVPTEEDVKVYGYQGDEMTCIAGPNFWTFKLGKSKPAKHSLKDAQVIEYLNGPDRQVFFHDGAAYFITFEPKKAPSYFALNEVAVKGERLETTQIDIRPKEARAKEVVSAPLMTPVPGGLAVYSQYGNRNVLLFSFKDRAFRAVPTGGAVKIPAEESVRVLFLQEQGLWRVTAAGAAEQLSDGSLNPPKEKVTHNLRLGGRVKRAVATTLDGKPVALLGIGEKESDDIDRLIFYDLKAGEKRKELSFKAATFAVPDEGDRVYLVGRSDPGIHEYDARKDTEPKRVLPLGKDVELREVRVCPLSPTK
jgi:hypothetical protein